MVTELYDSAATYDIHDIHTHYFSSYNLSPVSIQTQALAFLAVFVYATHTTHATQAIAFEWKPGFRCLELPIKTQTYNV